jgi:hypothetical protein
MAGDDSIDGEQIVRTFNDPNGRTCEGKCYQTADGKIWRERFGKNQYTRSGEILGYQIGNKIKRY